MRFKVFFYSSTIYFYFFFLLLLRQQRAVVVFFFFSLNISSVLRVSVSPSSVPPRPPPLNNNFNYLKKNNPTLITSLQKQFIHIYIR